MKEVKGMTATPRIVDLTEPTYDDCEYFLNSRHSWIDVMTVPGTFGGWDVVLRIDGTYTNKEDAEAMTEHFMELLLSLKDFDTSRLERVQYMRDRKER